MRNQFHISLLKTNSNSQRIGVSQNKRLLSSFGYVGSYTEFDIFNDLQLTNDWVLVIKQNKHELGVEPPLVIKKCN